MNMCISVFLIYMLMGISFVIYIIFLVKQESGFSIKSEGLLVCVLVMIFIWLVWPYSIYKRIK